MILFENCITSIFSVHLLVILLYIFHFKFLEGQLEISKDGRKLRVLDRPTVLGELAVLYNCTRTASVKGKYVVLILVEMSKRY